MTHATESKIDEAKDHLHAAKEEIKSAAQDKTAEKIEHVGEKIKDGLDNLAAKVSPDEKTKH
jgi:hypothetical protein